MAAVVLLLRFAAIAKSEEQLQARKTFQILSPALTLGAP
jgi:hypothetical protein